LIVVDPRLTRRLGFVRSDPRGAHRLARRLIDYPLTQDKIQHEYVRPTPTARSA
jgi:hypothetical protein